LNSSGQNSIRCHENTSTSYMCIATLYTIGNEAVLMGRCKLNTKYCHAVFYQLLLNALEFTMCGSSSAMFEW
jgi:hypothetical protein